MKIDKIERVKKIFFETDSLEISFNDLDDNLLDNFNNNSSPVIYWLTREMRAKNNWSLIFAKEIAELKNAPLCVVYNLIENKNPKKLQFEIDGLICLEKELSKYNIPLKIFYNKNHESAIKENIKFYKDLRIGYLITDFNPLREFQNQIIKVAKKLPKINFFEVDSHNIIPARNISNKQEFAARTFRPKVYKNIEEFLNPFPKIKKQNDSLGIKFFKSKLPKYFSKDSPLLNLITNKKYNWIKEGEINARKNLKKLINNNFNNYFSDRNDPNLKGQSDLSPYLHYGMISSQEIVLASTKKADISISRMMSSSRNRAKNNEVKKAAENDHLGAFLEELIVRKELSDNYCLYNKNYDNPAGFPKWAADSLYHHLKDKRKYVYSLDEFEKGQTYDNLWNAAQLQMVNYGKMHGYMRMY